MPYPPGDPLAFGQVRHLVEPVEKENQTPTFQKACAQSLGRSQVGAVDLLLAEGIEALIQVLQVPQGQEHGQHVRRKMDGLGVITQTP